MRSIFTMKMGLWLASFFIFQSVWANNDAAKSIFDMMNYQEILTINLKGDFEALTTNRRNEDSHKATLSFKDAQKEAQVWNIKLNLRGHFRRMNCEMPPLKLNFKKSELENAGLATFDDLKLVTHCSADQEEAKDWLQKEYLAYQLYRELTPNSFRVQMVRIHYIDTKTGKKDKNWGFLIEDTAQLAARMNAENIEQWGLDADDFHALDLKVMSLFQYMIGNTDWNVEAIKNVKMFKKDGKVIPVPYDFDFSGLVSTSYASPNSNYNLKSLKERVYMGFAQELYDMHDARAIFIFKKEDILGVISRSKMINPQVKFDMLDYLNEFFANVDNIQTKKPIHAKEIITAQSK